MSDPEENSRSRAASTASVAVNVVTRPGSSEPSGFVVGHPPSTPSPLALRASNSPSSKRRKRAQAPLVELRQLDYVSAVDDNLMCLICQAPFDQPCCLVACDHVFCKDCLGKTFSSQPRQQPKSCPTCRTVVEEPFQSIPRMILTMLDELVVKCPSWQHGCGWQGQRSGAQDHVELYCEFTMVECSADECTLEVMQKDLAKGCLHYTVHCEFCQVALLKQDLEEHQRNSCSDGTTECPHCGDRVKRIDFSTHTADVCTESLVACPGQICGCTFSSIRRFLESHSETCPMSSMAPMFRAQKEAIEEQARAQKLLVRKIDALEGTVASLQSQLSQPQASTPAIPRQAQNPTAQPLHATSGLFNGTTTNETHTTDDSHSAAGERPDSLSVFDRAVMLLGHQHASLSSEVAGLKEALEQLVARTDLEHVQNYRRFAEDSGRTDAAITCLRSQLTWLVNAYYQREQASLQTRLTALSAGAGAGAASTAPAATPASLGGDVGNGGGGVSASLGQGRPGARPAGVEGFRMRETNRQDTKL